jgi:hypothetical protein
MARDAHPSDLAVIAAVKAALSIAVLLAGFVAVSDDDYSRTVIAEQFAQAPSLDPSGTSWLPLPFWIHGAAMALFGRSLATAHATAILLGVAGALFIYAAALRLGASRLGALTSALLATAIPTAARLGISTQPEAIVAGLVVFAGATTLGDGWSRIAGGAALGAASLCRYEPWAAAAAFAVLAVYDLGRGPDDATRRVRHTSGFAPRRDRVRASRRALILSALVALAPALAWIAHGAAIHGDALFFLHRVAAYRRALGISESLATSLVAYPWALLRSEPELTLAGVAALLVARKRVPESLAVLARPALVLASLLAFLIVGRILDGAPTHHSERTLLPIWTLLALVVGEGAVRSLSLASRHLPRRILLFVAPAALAFAAGSIALRQAFSTDTGAPRGAERELGIAARSLLGPGERLLVDTKDYGYFAVIAAFGEPDRAAPFDRHDPREPAPADPFASPVELAARLDAADAAWLVVDRSHLPIAGLLGAVRATSGELSLVQVGLP